MHGDAERLNSWRYFVGKPETKLSALTRKTAYEYEDTTCSALKQLLHQSLRWSYLKTRYHVCELGRLKKGS